MEQKKDNDKEKKKFKEEIRKPSFWLIISICAILILLLFYTYFIRFDYLDLSELEGLSTNDLIILIIEIVLIFVGLIVVALFRKSKKEDMKSIKKHIYLLIISSLCATFVFITTIAAEIVTSIQNGIVIFAFLIGITWMFFELFSYLPEWRFNQLIHFPYYLVTVFFIPMVPILIIFLGAIHGKYNYSSTFLVDVQVAFVKFGILGSPFSKVVDILYNLGEGRPEWMIFLTIAAGLFLLYLTFKYSFYIEKKKWEENEENAPAEYFIEEAAKEEPKPSLKSKLLRLKGGNDNEK